MAPPRRKEMVIKAVLENMQRTARRVATDAFGLHPYKPVSVVMDLTRRCNLRCTFCDIWMGKDTDKDSSLEEITVMIDRLSAWLGNFQLAFLGGEPFLRKDLADILSLTARKGVLTSFVTNGTLITQKTADLLASKGVYGVTISLDTPLARTHDALRGVPGTHDRIMRGIDCLKKSRKAHGGQPRIGISSVVCRETVNDVPEMMDWILKKGLDSYWVAPVNGNWDTQIDDNWYKTSDAWLREKDMAALDRAVDCLISVKKKRGVVVNTNSQLEAMRPYFRLKKFPFKQCAAGQSVIGVRVNGDVQLCPFMAPIGNLLHDSPQSIWNSRKAEQVRHQVKACRKICGIVFCFYEKTFREKVERVLEII